MIHAITSMNSVCVIQVTGSSTTPCRSRNYSVVAIATLLSVCNVMFIYPKWANQCLFTQSKSVILKWGLFFFTAILYFSTNQIHIELRSAHKSSFYLYSGALCCLLTLHYSVILFHLSSSPLLLLSFLFYFPHTEFSPQFTNYLRRDSQQLSRTAELISEPVSSGRVNKKGRQSCSHPRTSSSGCYVNRSGLINIMHIISVMTIQMPACVNYCSRSHLHFCSEC